MKNESSKRHYHVIIPAAGIGSRAGLDAPKQFHRVHGRSILQRSIDIFDAHAPCQSITIALHPQDIHRQSLLLSADKMLRFIEGGESRKESVYNALSSLDYIKNEGLIFIHDAARPYLVEQDINRILAACDEGAQAVSLVKAVSDSLVRPDDYTRPNRDQLKALQTPQAFRYGLIKRAHEAAAHDSGATDDTALVTDLGEAVTFVQAQHFNDKITYPQDIIMADKLLQPAYETRTGLGYDVHAFESEANTGRPLMLCGVDVPHEYALTGHSDADVGLHTITDALLGAIGQGDIGRHFPPSDDTFKDMDSAIFLEKARDLVGEAGGQIINIDLTLICEAPKITPHADAMIARVAEILNIPQKRVSIKATTSERLGFTGRKEGIAAQAVATVKVPADG